MANQDGYSGKAPTGSALEGADFCEHTSHEDISKVVGYFYEKDSFGWVSVYAVCEECRAESQAQIDESTVCCGYCKLSFPKKETFEWRWYDFYAAQGDEPLIVCNGCGNSDAHKHRVARDREDYEHEFGIQDDDDSDLADGYDDDDDSWTQDQMTDEEEEAYQKALDELLEDENNLNN